MRPILEATLAELRECNRQLEEGQISLVEYFVSTQDILHRIDADALVEAHYEEKMEAQRLGLLEDQRYAEENMGDLSK